MSRPYPLLGLIGLYVWFSLSAGPRWMAQRKPYDPKQLKLVYNVFQVLGNGALFVYVSDDDAEAAIVIAYKVVLIVNSCANHLQGLRVSYWRGDFDLLCENWSLSTDMSERGYGLVWGGVFYLMLKVADLMDTVGVK